MNGLVFIEWLEKIVERPKLDNALPQTLEIRISGHG